MGTATGAKGAVRSEDLGLEEERVTECTEGTAVGQSDGNGSSGAQEAIRI